MIKQKLLYDIEIYKNFSYWAFRDYVTGKLTTFEISENRNDIHELYQFITSFKGFLIGFNSLHYDNMVTNFLITNYGQYKRLNYSDITIDLKIFSDKLINNDYEDSDIKRIKYIKNNWTDIDLFSYWSKMLRLSKKISLKSLGVQMGYPVVQELPFKPDTILKNEDLNSLKYYCYQHDLGILKLLVDNMEDEIKLRANIVSEYRINCWSMDAPKIASEALLQDYCKSTGKSSKEIRNQRFDKPILHLNECLKGFDPKFKLPIFQKLWTDILNSQNSFSQEILVNENNTNIRLTYGVGGLHSVNENEKYYSNDEYQVVTADFTSLYPNLMLNYGCIRQPEVLKRYDEIRSERAIAKQNKDKSKDSFLKLVLNSTSGMLDNQHSWLYYPEGAMRLRLIGQLILTKIGETCIINNWQTVSYNTDGIEVLVPRHQLQQFKDVLDIQARSFNLNLEYEYYDFIVYKNVNSYIAKTKEDKLKQKGLFVTNPILSNSCNELVIAKALSAYFIEDISPKDFISNPDKYKLHIYDYCLSKKISKDYKVYHNGKETQNLNRYYFSKHAPYLYKNKVGTNTMSHINTQGGVKLYNEHKDSKWEDYNINYSYYISQTQKIIDELSNFNQLTLF